jgi:hypothetical protein
MMNVNDAVRVMLYKVLSQDLHVAGQHDEAHIPPFEFQPDRLLLLVLRLLSHGKYQKLQPMAFHKVAQVRMIADHERKISGEFARLAALKQVLQAVVVFRNENGATGLFVRKMQLPVE